MLLMTVSDSTQKEPPQPWSHVKWTHFVGRSIGSSLNPYLQNRPFWLPCRFSHNAVLQEREKLLLCRYFSSRLTYIIKSLCFYVCSFTYIDRKTVIYVGINPSQNTYKNRRNAFYVWQPIPNTYKGRINSSFVGITIAGADPFHIRSEASLQWLKFSEDLSGFICQTRSSSPTTFLATITSSSTLTAVSRSSLTRRSSNVLAAVPHFSRFSPKMW